MNKTTINGLNMILSKRSILIVLLLYPACIALLVYLSSDEMARDNARNVELFLGFVECAVVALVVPLVSGNAILRYDGWRWSIIGEAITKGSLVLFGALVGAVVVSVLLSPVAVIRVALLQVFLLSFICLLVSFQAAIPARFAQWAATALGMLMLGSVFIANPFIAAAPEAFRSTLIKIVLYASPLVISSSVVEGVDILRAPVLYHHSSIASFQYSTPSFAVATILYFCISVPLLACAYARRRRKGTRLT